MRGAGDFFSFSPAARMCFPNPLSCPAPSLCEERRIEGGGGHWCLRLRPPLSRPSSFQRGRTSKPFSLSFSSSSLFLLSRPFHLHFGTRAALGPPRKRRGKSEQPLLLFSCGFMASAWRPTTFHPPLQFVCPPPPDSCEMLSGFGSCGGGDLGLANINKSRRGEPPSPRWFHGRIPPALFHHDICH